MQNNYLSMIQPGSIEVNAENPEGTWRNSVTHENYGPVVEVVVLSFKTEEHFIYACLIKEHPEAGILYFSPSSGSEGTCKKWNRLLRSQRFPNSKLAPIFAYSWHLALDLVPNPLKPEDRIAKFTTVTQGGIIDKDLFFQVVRPLLTAAQTAALHIAPEQSGDTEE
jgi:hypothetical protein